VPNVDYVLGDAIACSQEEDRYFTEKVWRLPSCFFCFYYEDDVLPPIAPAPAEQNGYVTFGCFGGVGKLNKKLLKAWAQILQDVPESILFLRNGDFNVPDNQQHIKQTMAGFGIGSERLRLLAGTDRKGVLLSYAEVDISLDSWPYCGGNTIAESLWQGVPVVTYQGDRFSSAYGASLISSVGYNELIGDSWSRYHEIAVSLANDIPRMTKYRCELREKLKQSAFGNPAVFVKMLEESYLGMLQEKYHPR
jgi:predicted O-linked N-acetylglucosamine transferase (SPINDLY family)